MPTDRERLDEANTCHDDTPLRAAELLREIEPAQLPNERWAGYAFLLNHVLGEKLVRWDEALARQRALLELAQPAPAAVLWRQGATAALLAQDDALAQQLTDSFAKAAGATTAHATELMQLSAAMYRVPGCEAEEAARIADSALAPLQGPLWQADTPIDAAVAACANNLASGLLERPDGELRQAPVRQALSQAAEQAHRFWLRSGTWVHHERALYLRAMVCHALDEPQWARGHAMAGLALLDAHDTEHAEAVDRAFLELELWAACERLALHDAAAQAQARAQSLAGQFNDDGLTRWFADRTAKLRSLPGMPKA